jgi:hypothetical protein
VTDPRTVDELHAELDTLGEQPVSRQADVLEALHSRLTAELDGLVIPRAEARRPA